LVEQRTENPRVVGSIPTLATIIAALASRALTQPWPASTRRFARDFDNIPRDSLVKFLHGRDVPGELMDVDAPQDSAVILSRRT
jgi:hypothetical protein